MGIGLQGGRQSLLPWIVNVFDFSCHGGVSVHLSAPDTEELIISHSFYSIKLVGMDPFFFAIYC